jgi:transcriptional regulator with XRE-family HTH domain
MVGVATSEKPIDRGTRRSKSLLSAFGEEFRRARLANGLNQATVGAAAGLSRSTVGRIERAEVDGLSIRSLCRLAAALGLELSVKAYPSGSPVRDAGHLALLDRARNALPVGSWTYEVPLPIANDPRAWDAIAQLAGGRLAVEAETRLDDVQALLRKLNLKQRDDPGVASVVLVVADTRWNRAVVREHLDALRASFPLDREALLVAMRSGRPPAANGMIVL